MDYQYRFAQNQKEVDEFHALRKQSFAERGMNVGFNDNADNLPGVSFFLMLDDSNKVLGGMRMVVQPFHDKKSFPSLNRLGVDFGEVFQRRGVDVSGMMVADISGIHVDRETVRQHPGVMVPFIGSCYRAALGKGAKLAVVAPSKPFDMVVQGVMKKLSVPCADLGDYEIKLPEKTESKHVMVYSPQKELVQLQERVVQ